MLLRNLSLIASIFVVSLGATPAFSAPIFGGNSASVQMAQMAQMGSHCDRGDGYDRGQMMEKLNLTDAQKKQFESLKKDHYNSLKPIKDKLRTKEDELRNLMSNNGSNEQLRSKQREIQELRQQMGNLHFENMLEIRAILTPEQRSQLGQMMGYRGNGRQR